MTIRPFYCRIGSKKKLLNKILPLIPEHKIYVEPFMGSSAVFWAKEPAEYTILNDLDKSLVDDYKLILKTPTPSRPITRKFIKTRTFVNNFYNNLTNSPIDKLIKRLMLRCNTFCSKTFNENEKVILYNRGNPYSKINKLDEYKERLKGVKILNQSYEKIIKKYDSPDTFLHYSILPLFTCNFIHLEDFYSLNLWRRLHIPHFHFVSPLSLQVFFQLSKQSLQ